MEREHTRENRENDGLETGIMGAAILSTPGTSGYYISYNRVLRAVLQKPLRWGIFLTVVMMFGHPPKTVAWN